MCQKVTYINDGVAVEVGDCVVNSVVLVIACAVLGDVVSLSSVDIDGIVFWAPIPLSNSHGHTVTNIDHFLYHYYYFILFKTSDYLCTILQSLHHATYGANDPVILDIIYNRSQTSQPTIKKKLCHLNI